MSISEHFEMRNFTIFSRAHTSSYRAERGLLHWISNVVCAIFIILACRPALGMSDQGNRFRESMFCDPPYTQKDNYEIEKAGEKFVELHIRQNIQVGLLVKYKISGIQL